MQKICSHVDIENLTMTGHNATAASRKIPGYTRPSRGAVTQDPVKTRSEFKYGGQPGSGLFVLRFET